jgi:predicted nucleic acid binding AN1-type Zn finger protein
MTDMKQSASFPSPILTSSGPILHMKDITLDSMAPKKEQRRCGCCKAKLLLTDFACKCATRYCQSHRLPEDHACSFDHKSAGKAILKEQLVRAVNDKMERC